jgi:putative aminopeptidase FrvX
MTETKISPNNGVDLTQAYVDIGAHSQAEAARMGVQVGDGLTWYGPLETIGNDAIRSKALDDRLGCLALLALAERLVIEGCDLDVCLAFIVQEETMLMGGVTAVNALQPDVVIGVDGTLAFDTPDLVDQQSDLRIGAGPALKIMDTVRGKQVSYVPTHELAKTVRRVAEQEDIALQTEIVVGLSTALSPLPYQAAGVQTLALSLPIRYHHSPVETADLRDAAAMIDLLVALLPAVAR